MSTTERLATTDQAGGTGTDSPMAAIPRWASWAVGLFLLALALRILANVRVIDLDLFHEMALIREALALGYLPKEDLFAYTSTVSPSVHHEWGTGAVLYLITVGLDLGSHGLSILRLLLLGVVAWCCVAIAQRRGASAVSLAVLAPLAIILFWPGLAPVRAHLFTFALLAILLYLLELDQGGSRRWLLLWPFLFVAWINLHGGFVVGMGMLGVYTLERLVRTGWTRGWPMALRHHGHLIGAGVVCIPLLLVNPYGLDYIPYMWHALLLDRPYIMEWSTIWSPGFRSGPLLFFLASLLILGYTLIRREGWARAPGVAMVLVAAVFAARSVRILPLYALVWIAYVPPALQATPVAPLLTKVWNRRASWIGGVALLVTVPLLVQTFQYRPWQLLLPTQAGVHEPHYPVGAVDYLEKVGFRGNLMTPFRVGAFVSWHLYPEVLVGLDSRYEVAYPPAFVEEGIRVYGGQGDWRDFVERYPTDAVLAPADGALDSLMVAQGGDSAPVWQEVYRDDGFVVFAHQRIASGLPITDRRGVPLLATFP